jgi:hypothetical protein
MIDRINQRIINSLAAQASSVSPKTGTSFDFNRILQDSLSSQSKEKPLEMASIELLYRTLEAILSEPETGESYLPLSSSPAFSSLNWSTLLSRQWNSSGVQGGEPIGGEPIGGEPIGGAGTSQTYGEAVPRMKETGVSQTVGPEGKIPPMEAVRILPIKEPEMMGTEGARVQRPIAPEMPAFNGSQESRITAWPAAQDTGTGRTTQDTGIGAGTLSMAQDTHGVEGIIGESAQKYNLDPTLIKAIISVESGGDPKALSPAGAQGLMQLMPATAAELGVTDPFDPAQNIMGGSRYLRQLLDRYQGNVRLALAAYNWGMGNLESRPNALPRETRNYITRVEEYCRT